MTAENIIAILDIGTTKITALVAEADEEGELYVIGHGVAPAAGLRRGIVVDMDKTVNSIRRAIDDAQLISTTMPLERAAVDWQQPVFTGLDAGKSYQYCNDYRVTTAVKQLSLLDSR